MLPASRLWRSVGLTSAGFSNLGDVGVGLLVAGHQVVGAPAQVVQRDLEVRQRDANSGCVSCREVGVCGAAGWQAVTCDPALGTPTPPAHMHQPPHLHGASGGVGLREVEGTPGQEGEGGGQREV